MSNEEKRKRYDLELEQSNPTISYEEYINVVNERNSLNNTLNNLTNEFNHFKNSINYSNQNYNNTNSNLNSTTQTYNTTNNSKKVTYYNVSNDQPVSAFAYYKYKIKQFFSNLLLIILSIVLAILIFNTFSNSNIFDYFNLFLK